MLPSIHGTLEFLVLCNNNISSEVANDLSCECKQMNNLRISLMHNSIDLSIIAAVDDLIIKHLVFSDGKRRSILSPMDTW